MNRLRNHLVVTLFALTSAHTLVACEGSDEAAGARDQELAPGAHGEAVQRLSAYLTRYGYFPNDKLAARYPGFEPLVNSAPPDSASYDATLAEGVREFQRIHGVEATGVADAKTLALMEDRDCDWPDGYEPNAERDESGNKFNATTRNKNITWRVTGGFGSQSIASVRAQVLEMVNVWKTVHGGTITEVSSNATHNIDFIGIDGISKDTNNDGECDSQCVLGSAGGGIHLDSAERWEFGNNLSTTLPFAQRRVDFRSVMLHELGHALGLGHSDRTDAVMYYKYTRGSSLRTLTEDDRTAMRSATVKFTSIATPAPVQDVHGGNTFVIITDEPMPGGGKVYQRSGSSWSALPRGAARVSADTSGRVWMVEDSGLIRVRNLSNTVNLALAGCGKDISVAANGFVWIVDCNGTIKLGYMSANATDEQLRNSVTAGFIQISAPGHQYKSVASLPVYPFAYAVDTSGALHGYTSQTGQVAPISLNQSRYLGDIAAGGNHIVWATATTDVGLYALTLQNQILYEPGTGVTGTAVSGVRGWQGDSMRSAKRVSLAGERVLIVDSAGALFQSTR